jgi:hypothetical protein
MTVDELAARGIRVKPLAWHPLNNGGMWAQTIFGKYAIHQRYFTGPDAYTLRGVTTRNTNTLEAAKAAAEADHAARIAAQLECSRDACEGPGVTG